MTRPSKRPRNGDAPIPTVDPGTKATFMVPRLSDPTELRQLMIEDAGFDDESGCYVMRLGLGGEFKTNQFDPAGVPFGYLSQARAMANAALLTQFDLDLAHAERLVS